MKPIYAQFASALALSFAIAACVPAPRPAPAPVATRTAATPSPTALPSPAFADWMDAPQTPGNWLYRASPQQSRASYGNGDSLLFQIICTADRRVVLVRPASGGAQMRVRTEAQDRALPAEARTHAVVATLRPGDRLLDAMALSKGRFAVEVPGTPTLYLPSWAEVSRVIEDCR